MTKKNRRYYRTLLLSVAAMGALVWVAVDQFGISWQVMRDLFLAVLLASAMIMALAAAVALVWILLRRLGRGSRQGNSKGQGR